MLGFGREDNGKPASAGFPSRAATSSFNLLEALRAPRPVNRRTQEEVRRLVFIFKEFFHGDSAARRRMQYFWPDVQQQDACLAALAHDIPSGEDPLAPAPAADKTGGRTREKKKKFAASIQSDCVHWLGLVNKINRFAAVQLKLPETYEPWVTYTNRLMVYLFASIPDYEGPDDFAKLLNVSGAAPFPMKCKNPLCVRLSHINYQLRDRRAGHISAKPRPMAESPDEEDDETNSESEDTS